MTDSIRPVLAGMKALVIGIANESSIAYGCASAFHRAGAEIGATWLNDKARPHVEPLAKELGATLLAPLDVSSWKRSSTSSPSNGAGSIFWCIRSPSRRRMI